MNQNNYVLQIFSYYILLLLGFGFFYYLLFINDPNHFFIPEQIADKKKRDTKIYLNNRIKELENESSRLIEAKLSYETDMTYYNKIISKRENFAFLSDSIERILKIGILNVKPDSMTKETRKEMRLFGGEVETEIAFTYHYRIDSLKFVIRLAKPYISSRSGGHYENELRTATFYLLNNVDKQLLTINSYTTPSEDKQILTNNINFKKICFDYEKDKYLFVKFVDFICSSYMILPNYEYYKTTLGSLEENHNKIAYSKQQLESNNTGWDSLDIAYFTIVSLGITNYSDISPNSTISRLLVLVQQILSVILLIYAINLKISDTLKKAEEDPPPV